jgi:hypothetical protein
LLRSLSPGKWMASSPGNLFSLSEPHDRHIISLASKIELQKKECPGPFLGRSVHSPGHNYGCWRGSISAEWRSSKGGPSLRKEQIG